MVTMLLFPTGLKAIIFWSVVLLWILTEAVGCGILPWLRRNGRMMKKKDNGSVLLIFAMMFVSYLIGIFLTIKNIAMLPLWFYYVGIFLMVTGILVRQWAIMALGHFFTVTVGVHKSHKVVDNGPYRLVRHPSYLGLLLIIAGTGFAVCSWGGVLVLIVMNGLAIGYRIKVEEKVLVSELGNDYVRYMKKTKRLIPFVY